MPHDPEATLQLEATLDLGATVTLPATMTNRPAPVLPFAGTGQTATAHAAPSAEPLPPLTRWTKRLDAPDETLPESETARTRRVLPFSDPQNGLRSGTIETGRQSDSLRAIPSAAENAEPLVGAVKPQVHVPAAPTPQDPEPAAAPGADQPDPNQFPIDRFAAISAKIAEGRRASIDVLRLHGIGALAWNDLKRYFATAFEEESTRGSTRLRKAFDEAYVEAVEKVRGPIVLADYARIVVGLERGRVDTILDTLKIQRPALMPVVRLWTKKIAADMRLAGEAQAAIRAARNA